jgi:hypothetical protein
MKLSIEGRDGGPRLLYPLKGHLPFNLQSLRESSPLPPFFRPIPLLSFPQRFLFVIDIIYNTYKVKPGGIN